LNRIALINRLLRGFAINRLQMEGEGVVKGVQQPMTTQTPYMTQPQAIYGRPVDSQPVYGTPVQQPLYGTPVQQPTNMYPAAYAQQQQPVYGKPPQQPVYQGYPVQGQQPGYAGHVTTTTIVMTQPQQQQVIYYEQKPPVDHCCHCFLCFLTMGLTLPCWCCACWGCGCERPCG